MRIFAENNTDFLPMEKSLPNEVGGIETTPPEKVGKAMRNAFVMTSCHSSLPMT